MWRSAPTSSIPVIADHVSSPAHTTGFEDDKEEDAPDDPESWLTFPIGTLKTAGAVGL
jgi:hypothetical protein